MIHHVDNALNTSMSMGMMALLLNYGSRYIMHEWSSSDEEYSQYIVIRRLCIFAVCFTATHDVIISILLTAGFVVLAAGFLRGKPFSREGMRADPNVGGVDAPAFAKDPPMFGGNFPYPPPDPQAAAAAAAAAAPPAGAPVPAAPEATPPAGAPTS